MSPTHHPDDHLRMADTGFVPCYRVVLLYESELDLDVDQLEKQLRTHAPDIVTANRGAEGIELRHRANETAQRWYVRPPTAANASELAGAARQSWWWEAGRELLPRCRVAMAVEDAHASDLDHRQRLASLQRCLVATVCAAPCLALYWQPTQQLVDPMELVENLLADDYSSPLPGAVNVRFFRIDREDSEEALMDTLGLAAVGLPDLQCHFRGLDPSDVSRVLYSTACYLYDQGPVIRSGNTVQGPNPGDRWGCRLEDAIAEPRRPVLDLDPGFPFAGGESEEGYVLDSPEASGS